MGRRRCDIDYYISIHLTSVKVYYRQVVGMSWVTLRPEIPMLVRTSKHMTACEVAEPELAGDDRVQEEHRTRAVCTLASMLAEHAVCGGVSRQTSVM